MVAALHAEGSEASRSSLCPAAGFSEKVRKTTGSRSCPAGAKGKIRMEEDLPDVAMLTLAKGELTDSDENREVLDTRGCYK